MSVVDKYKEPGGHFALFGMEPVFDIDKKLLLARYIELQSRYHPDKLLERSDGAESAFINDCYRTLESDIDRAEYLIVCVFGHTEASDPGVGFFEQMIEIREEMRSLDGEAKKMLKNSVAVMREEYFASLVDLLGDGDVGGAALSLSRIKYVDSIIKEFGSD